MSLIGKLDIPSAYFYQDLAVATPSSLIYTMIMLRNQVLVVFSECINSDHQCATKTL